VAGQAAGAADSVVCCSGFDEDYFQNLAGYDVCKPANHKGRTGKGARRKPRYLDESTQMSDTLSGECVREMTNSKGGSTMGSSERSKSGNLAGFFVGAFVGAGIALLSAPQAGAQLRGFLRDAAGSAKDELNEAVEHGTEVLDSAVGHGQEFVEKGKESLRETSGQAKEFAMAGRKAFNDTRDELASQHR
jgi:gas vesicle protein